MPNAMAAHMPRHIPGQHAGRGGARPWPSGIGARPGTQVQGHWGTRHPIKLVLEFLDLMVYERLNFTIVLCPRLPVTFHCRCLFTTSPRTLSAICLNLRPLLYRRSCPSLHSFGQGLLLYWSFFLSSSFFLATSVLMLWIDGMLWSPLFFIPWIYNAKAICESHFYKSNFVNA